MSLRFQCKHCQGTLVVKFLTIGEKAKCGNCGKLSIVPEDAVYTEEESDARSPVSDLREAEAVDQPSMDENRLNKLALKVSKAMFYSTATFITSTYFSLRSVLTVPNRIEPVLHSWLVSLFVIGLMGMIIPSLILICALPSKVFLHFKHGQEFEILYSEHATQHRRSWIYFVAAALVYEFLIDIWFLFE